MIRLVAVSFFLLASAPVSTIEVSLSVPQEQDACVDHAVKELGMSAKRVEKERKWNIGPQFLHPSVVKGGSVRVEMKPTSPRTVIWVEASWLGPPKEPAVQKEIEERLTSMVTKMGQLCGVNGVKPDVKVTPGAP